MHYGKKVKKPKSAKGPKTKTSSGTKMSNKYGVNAFTGDQGTLCS
tara:strand:- start:581 stop:715 length:135 start_codon:yes stop_codon:yes gene_type:complete